MTATAPLRIRTVLLALLPLVLCGCTTEWEEGGVSYFAYDLPTRLLMLGLGLAIFPLGWLIRRDWERGAWGLMIGGVVMLCLTPDYWLNYVGVGSKRMTYRQGFILSAEGEVKFDDVEAMTLTTKVSRGKRGRRTTTNYLNCHMKDGTILELTLDHLMDAARPKLAAVTARQGIPIIDDRDSAEDP